MTDMDLQAASPLIKIRNVWLQHLPDSSVNFWCRRGEVIGLSGKNGAGKTTFLRYLAGLDSDTAGNYFAPGPELQIGLVFQHPEDNLIFSGLREDVKFGCKNFGLQFTEKKYQDLLDFFLLDEEDVQNYQWMNAGISERAALASIWSQAPQIILLDEAFSNQDADTAGDIFSRMISQAKTKGQTIILATHEPDLLRMTDIVYHMQNGLMTESPEKDSAEYASGNPINMLISDEKLIRGSEQTIFGKDKMTLSGFSPTESNAETSALPAMLMNDFSFGYSDELLFRKQSCSLNRGNLYYLSGLSGAGKSTLLLLMAALLPLRVGEIQISDKDMSGELITLSSSKKRKIRRRIGFMGQHAERQLFGATVWEDTAFSPKNFGITGTELTDQCENALRSVGLPESLWKRSTGNLSTGEKRKAVLAGIIAAKPDILLLDDPYAEIDSEGIRAINRLIMTYIADGRTVVVSGAKHLNV